MKFKFLFVPLLFIATQTLGQEKAFNKNTSVFDATISIGTPFWSGYNSLPIVPRINYEKAVSDNISIGGTASFSTAKDKFFNIRYNAYFIGGRGSFHFATSEKLDPYAGLSLGYVILSVRDNEFFDGYDYGVASAVGWGAYAGLRYYFNKRTAFNAELGYASLSILNAGISFKF